MGQSVMSGTEGKGVNDPVCLARCVAPLDDEDCVSCPVSCAQRLRSWRRNSRRDRQLRATSSADVYVVLFVCASPPRNNQPH